MEAKIREHLLCILRTRQESLEYLGNNLASCLSDYSTQTLRCYKNLLGIEQLLIKQAIGEILKDKL